MAGGAGHKACSSKSAGVSSAGSLLLHHCSYLPQHPIFIAMLHPQTSTFLPKGRSISIFIINNIGNLKNPEAMRSNTCLNLWRFKFSSLWKYRGPSSPPKPEPWVPIHFSPLQDVRGLYFLLCSFSLLPSAPQLVSTLLGLDMFSYSPTLLKTGQEHSMCYSLEDQDTVSQTQSQPRE